MGEAEEEPGDEEVHLEKARESRALEHLPQHDTGSQAGCLLDPQSPPLLMENEEHGGGT